MVDVMMQWQWKQIKYGTCCGILAIAVSMVFFGLTGIAESPPPPPPLGVERPTPDYTIYTLKPGTSLFVVLQTPIRTDVNQPGDPVEVLCTQDVYLANRLILSKQTRLFGYISILEQPIQGRNAVLAVRFNRVILPSGEEKPISAYVKTEYADHTWGGEITPGTEVRRVTYRVMGVGAYNRAVNTGPRAMGAHYQAVVGEHWTVVLEQPLEIVLPNSVAYDQGWRQPPPWERPQKMYP